MLKKKKNIHHTIFKTILFTKNQVLLLQLNPFVTVLFLKLRRKQNTSPVSYDSLLKKNEHGPLISYYRFSIKDVNSDTHIGVFIIVSIDIKYYNKRFPYKSETICTTRCGTNVNKIKETLCNVNFFEMCNFLRFFHYVNADFSQRRFIIVISLLKQFILFFHNFIVCKIIHTGYAK